MKKTVFSQKQKNKLQNSRIGKSIFITAFVLFAVVLGIAIRPWVTEKPASAKENGNNDVYQQSQNVGKESVTPQEHENALLIENNSQSDTTTELDALTQTSNGIEITVKNFHREVEFILADICLEMPDNSDWMLDYFGTSLEFGEEKVILQGFNNIEYIPFEIESKSGYRCDTAKFQVPSYADNGEFILNITQISAPPREGSECQFFLNHVQNELDARNSDIKIGCTKDGSGTGVIIEEKPPEMSISEAESIVLNPEFFAFHGAWKFQFNLEQ